MPLSNPIFSLLHTSARPDQWQKIFRSWLDNCSAPDLVEYVLVVDERWGFSTDHQDYLGILRPQDKLIFNTKRRCYVDGVNTAAKRSTGKILIVIADDQYCPSLWDQRLLELSTAGIRTRSDEFVVEVNTGTPMEHDRGIMVMPILSRKRYERYGYVFYPEYESMYADNDFCALARRDGCVIDMRDRTIFPHKHFLTDQSVTIDEQYKEQMRPEAFARGRALFEARKANDFCDVHLQENPASQIPTKQKSIAVCLPGERFSMLFLSAWTTLLSHMLGRYLTMVHFGYSSSVFVTRNALALETLNSGGANVDYVLWLDDDNTLTPDQLEILIHDLDSHPDLAGVVGWCWVQTDGYAVEGTVSVGRLDEIGRSLPLREEELQTAPGALIPIDWSGFPCVLMRPQALMTAKCPFTAIVDERFSWGMAGEDVSFFIRAKKAGMKFAVDRRVEVPHFKTRAVRNEQEPFKYVKAENILHRAEPNQTSDPNPDPDPDHDHDLVQAGSRLPGNSIQKKEAE